MNLPFWEPLNGTIQMCKLSSRADRDELLGYLSAFLTRRNKAQLGEVWELHKDLARAICQTTFPHLDLGKEKVLKNVLDIKSTKKRWAGWELHKDFTASICYTTFPHTHTRLRSHLSIEVGFDLGNVKKNTQTCSWYLLSLNAINDKLEPWLQQGAYKIYSVMFFTIITPTNVQIVHCTYQPWKCITKVH